MTKEVSACYCILRIQKNVPPWLLLHCRRYSLLPSCQFATVMRIQRHLCDPTIEGCQQLKDSEFEIRLSLSPPHRHHCNGAFVNYHICFSVVSGPLFNFQSAAFWFIHYWGALICNAQKCLFCMVVAGQKNSFCFLSGAGTQQLGCVLLH